MASSAARSESVLTPNVCPYGLSWASPAVASLGSDAQLVAGHPAAWFLVRVGDQQPGLAAALRVLGRLPGGHAGADHGRVVQVQPGGGQEGQPPDAAVEAEEALHVAVGRAR